MLGPLLWNLGYDRVLRGAVPPGFDVVYYADDTLVMVRGHARAEIAALAELRVELLVRRIEELGLRVALEKTETMWFHGPRVKLPTEESFLDVHGIRVEVGATMSYLGLILDSRWDFRAHFARKAPRHRQQPARLAGYCLILRGLEETPPIFRRGTVHTYIWSAGIVRGSGGKQDQLDPAQKGSKNHRHQGLERIPHHVLRGGVPTGGGTAVGHTGGSLPTHIGGG